VDFQSLISNILSGMSYGSVYALLAVGLVLTYKTSGIFNLAYGAQAFVAGAVYYDVRVRHQWSIPLAFILAVLVVSPLLGILLDRGLFRYLRTASPAAKLVTVLGLLVAIPQILKLWFGQNPQYGTSGIVPHGDKAYNPFGTVFVSRDDIATIGITLLAVGGLILLFRYTALGLRMRAVVESPRMTELAGIDADRVSMASWILCSILAGLAGVLLAPLFAAVSELNYTTLVVVAMSAAVLASLTSIPVAFLGGLGLGVLGEVIDSYLPTNSVLASNLRPALPFIVLFLVLILSPALRNRREAADPLAGVDPPPPPPAAATRSPFLTKGTRVFGVLVGAGMAYYLFFHAAANWVTIAIQAAILATIFLSITVITGMAGEISLCVATFAAIGACTTAQLSTRFGVAVMLAMVVGAVIAAAVGALLALPALRLGGIFLSLATYAFALFFDSVMVKFDWVGGGGLPEPAPRPTFGSIDFDASDRSFLFLCIIVLVIVSIIVIAVREGTTGRVLDALRGSEVAATSIGISATRARIVVFSLSAAIAAVGGGMMAMNEKAANITPNLVPFQGLVFVVLVVSLGSRTVEGAIQAAIGYSAFQIVILNQALPWLVNNVQPWYHMGQPPQTLAIILLSIGAFTYAKHPEGVLEFQKRRSLDKVQRTIDRFKGGGKVDGAVAEQSDSAPEPFTPTPAPAAGSS
jgi:branched-subunit amino acid ABC-type transport system permease component